MRLEGKQSVIDMGIDFHYLREADRREDRSEVRREVAEREREREREETKSR